MKLNKLVMILAGALLVVLGVVSYLLSSGKLTSEVPFQTSLKNTEVQSDSDEIPAIEEDLNDTNLQELDKELDDISAEIEAGY